MMTIRTMTMALLALAATAAHGYSSMIVDPQFAYYLDRSPESIVEELRANGFENVRIAAVNESGIRADLVKAFAKAEVKTWMLTFVNGAYSTADLPKGWEAWRMKLKKGGMPDGFTYLCLTNSDYRDWKKKQLTAALNAHPFYGVDLGEAFLPAYRGPESDLYGCLCDRCVEAFRKMHPEVGGLPDFKDTTSPRYWKRDTTLYDKWVGFRVSTVVNALDDLVNGKGGIREKCPKARVCTWSLGLDVPDQIAKLREWEALDAAAIVKRVKPDMHLIQTDWPDWIKDDLSPRYPLKYKPVADAVRAESPGTPLLLQADIGSKQNMRRNRDWIKRAEDSAKKIGCEGVTCYEYHIGEYTYTEAPAVLSAEPMPGYIKLVFSKRLDAVSASNVANYTISSGKIDYARVDGNIVSLSVSGVEGKVTVQISGLSDDPSRRLFKDKPVCTMERSIQVTVEWVPEAPVEAS